MSGILELILLALYLIPSTSVLGVVLWTGFLDGSTLTQLRVGNPFLTHVLFPSYIAAFLWGGLYLREGRLAPLRGNARFERLVAGGRASFVRSWRPGAWAAPVSSDLINPANSRHLSE